MSKTWSMLMTWAGAMLTAVLLMMAVDPSGYQEPILKLLQELQSLDSTRCTYYCDLRSRFFMERCIEELGSKTELDLSGHGLTAVVHPELLPMLQELDLSENELTQTPCFSFFQCLRKLKLAKNKLKSCQGLSYLPCLQWLDLSGNYLTTVECVKPLHTSRQLQSLNLTDNPLCQEPCALDRLQELFPGVEILGFQD